MVRIVLIIVDLGCLEPHVVYSYFFGQFLYILDLMLIRFYNEKLEYYKWCSTFQLLLPLHNITGALEHFVQPSTNTVLLVHVLRGSVNRNDQTIQATFNGTSCIVIVKVMRIRRCCSIYFLSRRITYHIQEIRVQVRLPLEIEYEVEKVFIKLVDRFGKKISLQHPGRPCKGSQPAWAFRAAKIAGSCGFE